MTASQSTGFQFSLRALFALVTYVALIMAAVPSGQWRLVGTIFLAVWIIAAGTWRQA